ncbi:hypothetical protein [Heyndrickxia ginsengihumi]|nr:hypothetical protein [Heyndrickxia ginsengihumi]
MEMTIPKWVPRRSKPVNHCPELSCWRMIIPSGVVPSESHL